VRVVGSDWWPASTRTDRVTNTISPSRRIVNLVTFVWNKFTVILTNTMNEWTAPRSSDMDPISSFIVITMIISSWRSYWPYRPNHRRPAFTDSRLESKLFIADKCMMYIYIRFIRWNGNELFLFVILKNVLNIIFFVWSSRCY